MTKELKTLKDLENTEWRDGSEDDFGWVDVDDLREEAIKWVKDCCGGRIKCLGCIRMMEFNNITKEDLPSRSERK